MRAVRLDDISLDPDPVIEAYKKDIDTTLLEENLRLTTAQRLERLQALYDAWFELQRSRERAPR